MRSRPQRINIGGAWELTVEYEDWGAVRLTVPDGKPPFMLPPEVLRLLADEAEAFANDPLGRHIPSGT